jgi:signal peptidase I
LAKRETKPGTAKRPAKAEHKETWLEFIASMAVVLATGLFIITFNIQAFEIPSSSMENTLLIGDHVFVDRISYAPPTRWMPLTPYTTPKRHDIVVFLSPAQPGLYVVKRVIGIPGDRIRLRDGVLFLNGVRQDEPYVIHSRHDYIPYRDNFPAVPPPDFNSITPEWHVRMRDYIENGELVVPPDAYFGMGDNRDVSYDSRFWGFIPRENIIGRPTFIYWSFETPPDQYEKRGLAERIGFIFKVVIHFFDQTRWRRMFHLVR